MEIGSLNVLTTFYYYWTEANSQFLLVEILVSLPYFR